MSIIPTNPRKILVLHGIETDYGFDQTQHKDIDNLIKSRMTTPFDYETEMFSYESITDDSQFVFKKVMQHLADGIMAGEVIGRVVDLIGDIVVALNDSDTAAEIKHSLRQRILTNYKHNRQPLYIVAHSIGSIYALDVINELMMEEGLFDTNDRTTWPVQALITMGSPVGLSIFGKINITRLSSGTEYFRWYNYWDRTDPIVTGSLFGLPNTDCKIAESVGDPDDTGWVVRDNILDTGHAWLSAHTSYWHHEPLGDDLITLLTT